MSDRPDRPVTAIAFDADDTLWHNERFFQDSQARFGELLADFATPHAVDAALLATEKRNIALYGFGVKGFTLSMLETAREIAGDRLPASAIDAVLELGKEMLAHPVMVFPHVAETLAALKADHTLLVITKGDLFDQERKLTESGLQDHFDHIEIVSDKTTDTYRNIFDRHGRGTSRAMMVGNSMRSDILPALEAGCWAVHVPHDLTWALEEAPEPQGNPRYRRMANIAAVPDLVRDIQQAC